MSDRAAADTDEAMVALARAVAADPTLADPSSIGADWSTLSLVIGRTAGAPTIGSMRGFRYQADDSWAPTDIDFDVVVSPFEQIIAAMAEHEAVIGTGWVKCLFQLQRSSGDSKFQYEWLDETRWEVDPTNANVLPEQIRPVFKDKGQKGVAPRRLPPGSLL